VGPHPGFRVSFWLRLVGMWGVTVSDHEGEPRSDWPWALWLGTVTLLSVGFECVVLIFMAGRCLRACWRMVTRLADLVLQVPMLRRGVRPIEKEATCWL
jgi:hypothetical protein